MPTAAIEFRGARAVYPDGTVAVDGLDLHVRAHELLVLVGPSGCGKSTTLRMVNRLVPLAAGQVLVGGQDVAAGDPVALRRRIGYVIQHAGLFPHRTVAANVGTVPTLLGWPRERVRARTAEMLELVGLPPSTYGRRYPHQLSGGEQQRVGVARALAADPPVLLMDEPFGAVDPIGRRRLQEEFWRIQRAVGTTVIFVTHDVDEAVRLGDRIVVMGHGGHPEQVTDAVTLLAHPVPGMVTDFVGAGRAARLLPITEVELGDLVAPLGGPASPGGHDDDAGPTLRLGDRLDAALAALVVRDVVDVTDGTAMVGRLTADGVLRALRRVIDRAPDDEDDEDNRNGEGRDGAGGAGR
ncbi:MAG: ATP-binding cassette domain-containing protein [Micrococcales bacterium]|nr:ATP-binding cassette domain-containing protein [Micrococcales bacterium]